MDCDDRAQEITAYLLENPNVEPSYRKELLRELDAVERDARRVLDQMLEELIQRTFKPVPADGPPEKKRRVWKTGVQAQEEIW